MIADRWLAWGVETVFAVPGAALDPLVGEVAADPRFRLVNATHEQGAGYMADGIARSGSIPGVVLAPGGPGATNLVTAAVTARLDGSPVLFLTGDVPTTVATAGGFQAAGASDSNTIRLLHEALGVSLHPDTLGAVIAALDTAEALLFAHTPAPAHLCIPIDLLRAPSPTADSDNSPGPALPPPVRIPPTEPAPSLSAIPRLALLVGGEIRRRSRLSDLAALCRRLRIPAASTMEAKDFQALLPDSLQLGVFGYAGGPRAQAALLDSSEPVSLSLCVDRRVYASE